MAYIYKLSQLFLQYATFQNTYSQLGYSEQFKH